MPDQLTVKVSFFRNAKDDYADPQEIPWKDFADSFLTSKLVTTQKIYCPAYSPTCFIDNKRNKLHALSVHFGVVDIDDAPVNVLQQHIRTIEENQLDAVIYQTWRSAEANAKGLFRYRIVVALSRPIDVEAEWDQWWPKWFAFWGGADACVDEGACKDRARLYFGPCLPSTTPPEVVRPGLRWLGRALDVDTLLMCHSVPTDLPVIDDGRAIRYNLDSVRAVLKRFQRSHNPKRAGMQGPLKALVEGQPFADVGERYTVLRDLCWHLVDELPHPDLKALATLFEPSLACMNASVPFDKWPDVEGLLRSAMTKRVATAPLTFQRGDAAEVAEHVLKDLRSEYEQLVSAEGGLWGLRDGLWWGVSSDDVARRVLGLAGSKVGRGDLMIHGSLMDSVRKMTPLLLDEDVEFFRRAPAGRAFSNGFVSVLEDRLVLEPLEGRHRVRVAHDFPMLLEAPEPVRWMGFLRETYEENEAKIWLLQEFFGAALAGIATRFERALVLRGNGHDGKSQVLNVLEGLFLPEEFCSISPSEWAGSSNRARMVGKALNCVRDLSVRARVFDSEYFKQIISGEPIEARELYQKAFRLCPTAAHAFSTNILPATSDHTKGYYRRWLIVEHERQHPEGTAVTDLGRKILTTERGAITAWALRGAVRLLARGRYDIPDVVAEALEDYSSHDPIKGWLEDHCKTGNGASTGIDALFDNFLLWCMKNGVPKDQLTKRQFAGRLKSKGLIPSSGCYSIAVLSS